MKPPSRSSVPLAPPPEIPSSFSSPPTVLPTGSFCSPVLPSSGFGETCLQRASPVPAALENQQAPSAVRIPPDKTSFRDVCFETSVPAPVATVGLDIVKEQKAVITFRDGNPLLPEFTLEEGLFNELCKPWEEAIIVKLLGKTVGYRTMLEGLSKVWRLKGQLDLMDVGKGFFMAKFDRISDREMVFNEGPWMLCDHYLAISDWSPKFSSETATVDRTRVWIRFPGLNLLYYDDRVLLGLASVVGRPIKVDRITSCMERGRFARVCIEIDLNKPVVGKVFIKGHQNLSGYWQKIEYEGSHLICSDCGRYGHLNNPCMYGNKSLQAERKEDALGSDSGEAPRSHKVRDVDINPHGEWLVVRRRKQGSGFSKSVSKGVHGGKGFSQSVKGKAGLHVVTDVTATRLEQEQQADWNGMQVGSGNQAGAAAGSHADVSGKLKEPSGQHADGAAAGSQSSLPDAFIAVDKADNSLSVLEGFLSKPKKGEGSDFHKQLTKSERILGSSISLAMKRKGGVGKQRKKLGAKKGFYILNSSTEDPTEEFLDVSGMDVFVGLGETDKGERYDNVDRLEHTMDDEGGEAGSLEGVPKSID